MNRNEILIFGKGYLGSRLAEEWKCNITDKRINSLQDAQEEIEKYKPGIIINCIGHTGINNVDDCEINKDKTLNANSFVPIILAEIALRNKIKLAHISSGCIYKFNYENQEPINENLVPDSFDLFYSRSKIYSEKPLEALSKKYDILIIRIRIPLDNRSDKRNILNKLIKYKKIIDLPNSVTYIPDLINALEHLINVNARGIYNVVNKGGLRYPLLLNIYKKYVPEFKYDIISLKELNLSRTNMILSVKKLEESGFSVRHINEVLEESVLGFLKNNDS